MFSKAFDNRAETGEMKCMRLCFHVAILNTQTSIVDCVIIVNKACQESQAGGLWPYMDVLPGQEMGFVVTDCHVLLLRLI